MEWLESDRGRARDFRIETAERPVTGAVWLPEETTATTPLVLFGHGGSGDRYQVPIPHLASRFLRQGVASLAMDGPVHGLRQKGSGDRVDLMEAFERDELTDEMVADWLLALAAVRKGVGLDGNPLAYFGLSMGTIFGIPTLAAAARLGISFRTSVLGLAGSTGVLEFLGGRLLKDAADIDHPVLFLMQLEDELFDRKGCLRLFDALGSGDKRLHANPGLHPEVPVEEIDASFEFLSNRLTADVPLELTDFFE